MSTILGRQHRSSRWHRRTLLQFSKTLSHCVRVDRIIGVSTARRNPAPLGIKGGLLVGTSQHVRGRRKPALQGIDYKKQRALCGGTRSSPSRNRPARKDTAKGCERLECRHWRRGWLAFWCRPDRPPRALLGLVASSEGSCSQSVLAATPEQLRGGGSMQRC